MFLFQQELQVLVDFRAFWCVGWNCTIMSLPSKSSVRCKFLCVCTWISRSLWWLCFLGWWRYRNTEIESDRTMSGRCMNKSLKSDSIHHAFNYATTPSSNDSSLETSTRPWRYSATHSGALKRKLLQSTEITKPRTALDVAPNRVME